MLSKIKKRRHEKLNYDIWKTIKHAHCPLMVCQFTVHGMDVVSGEWHAVLLDQSTDSVSLGQVSCSIFYPSLNTFHFFVFLKYPNVEEIFPSLGSQWSDSWLSVFFLSLTWLPRAWCRSITTCRPASLEMACLAGVSFPLSNLISMWKLHKLSK